MPDAPLPAGARPASPLAAILREPLLRRGFAAYWTVFAVLFFANDFEAGLPRSPQAAWLATRNSFLFVGLWLGVCLAALHTAGRFPLEGARRRSLAGLAAAALLTTAVYLAVVRGTMCGLGWGACGPPRDLLRPAPTVLWIFLGIVGAGHALRAVVREREHAAARGLLEARVTEARLAALRMQLQPHFLFNALQSVSTLMHRDVDAAEAVLEGLGGLVRRTTARGAAQLVPLREELETVRLYTGIEAVRFSDRLRVETHVDPDALDALVPVLLLQPLVENAIRHGVSARRGPGRVEVEAALRGGRLRLSVRDDGPGFAAGRPGTARGIGLANTRERLQALYGRDHGFEAGACEGGGARVTITIPLRRAGAAAATTSSSV